MPLNSERRQQIVRMIPEGVIVTRKELMTRGLTRHAIDNLVKSRQLESHAYGVYTKPGSPLTWEGVVYSLQHTFYDFTIGGTTAMELQGLAHYLPLAEKRTVHLYSDRPLPKWVNHLTPDAKMVRHSKRDLFNLEISPETENKKQNIAVFKDFLHEFLISYRWKYGALEFDLSSPERAYLEVLLEVPNNISFEHADQLMQGLTSLSPNKVQRLLEKCHNVKVKRLFLWFAQRHNYKWFHKLNLENINLGSGNRVLVKGGKLDPKYKITVPENL